MCCDLSVHMATTLIENFKKVQSETFAILMVSKFKKYFHGNIKACNFMLF